MFLLFYQDLIFYLFSFFFFFLPVFLFWIIDKDVPLQLVLSQAVHYLFLGQFYFRVMVYWNTILQENKIIVRAHKCRQTAGFKTWFLVTFSHRFGFSLVCSVKGAIRAQCLILDLKSQGRDENHSSKKDNPSLIFLLTVRYKGDRYLTHWANICPRITFLFHQADNCDWLWL